MYSEIPQGRTLNIQGLNCNIPPEGYVYNNLTKQLEYVGIYSRSDNPKEQYWERFQYPSWYKEVTKREDEYLKKKKEDDPPFYDERYEEYKQYSDITTEFCETVFQQFRWKKKTYRTINKFFEKYKLIELAKNIKKHPELKLHLLT